jgi:hypothetical protein
MNRPRKPLGALLLAIALSLTTSGSLFAGGLFDPEFDPDDFPDTPNIDNPYWPLVPGTVFLYFAEAEDGCEWNLVQVTYATKEIAEIDTVVVLDMEWLDEDDDCDEVEYDLDDYDPLTPRNTENFPGNGWLTESTLDWYAQDDDGNIWYLGEYTLSFDWDDCEGATIVTDFGLGCTDGSFEAGVNDAEAGIVMMANPTKGTRYQQEYDEGNAEDWGKVLNFIKIDDTECLKTKEWTPLERGAIEHKYYCPEDGLLLIEGVSGGPKVWTELVDTDTYEDD